MRAPTLYHHFASKDGLLDEVVSHGFRRFLAARAGSGEELDDLRAGWDLHVRFGLEHPAFYRLIYGRGEPCGVVAQVEAMLLESLRGAGPLRVPPEQAARQLLAASTGVVLTLLAQEAPDLALSTQVREAILAGLVADAPADLATVLSPGEAVLLAEWMARV